MLEISTSATSPAFMKTGGSRLNPTPPGVPVAITSPGSSSVKPVRYSMMVGMSKIIKSVGARCISLPLSRVTSVSFDGSGSSSVVTSQGPNPPVAGKFFPGVHCEVWNCQSRSEPSW